MIICHEPALIFVHIPKTAGTSVANALAPFKSTAPDTRIRRIFRKLSIRQKPQLAHFRSHDTAAQVKAAFGAQIYAHYEVFSIVRNPFDHAISHYKFMCELPSERGLKAVDQLSFAEYLRNRIRPTSVYPRKPFARMKDQLSFVSDAKGDLIVDTVFDFSEISSKLPAYLTEKGIDMAELPHDNKTIGRGKSSSEFFTDETTSLVRSLYHRDFDAFGYSREVPVASS